MEALRVSEDVAQVWLDFKADQTRRDLRNQLMEKYFSIVRYHGERVWSRLPDGVELDDLISAGIFGLMDAIKAYDLYRGVKFETYCVPSYSVCSERSYVDKLLLSLPLTTKTKRENRAHTITRHRFFLELI